MKKKGEHKAKWNVETFAIGVSTTLTVLGAAGLIVIGLTLKKYDVG